VYEKEQSAKLMHTFCRLLFVTTLIDVDIE